jgi:hypothetical protein
MHRHEAAEMLREEGFPSIDTTVTNSVDRTMARPIPATLLAIAVLYSSPAFANEFCDKELAPMIDQRKALTAKLNSISKTAKANPENARKEFCGTITAYVGNIQKFLTYLQQNKDFCGIPDEAIDSAKKGLAQNQTMRRKVCVAAAQPRPQQQGQGQPAIPRPPVELRLQ